MTDEKPEGGAADERSDSPLAPTEADVSPTPPSQGSSDVGGQVPGEHDTAESAKSTDV
jgi:hypothetical protein